MSLSYTSYKNYLSQEAYVYPAANRNDGGEDNSEKNLKMITDKFAIKSFIVKRDLHGDPEYFNVTFDEESSAGEMSIDRGECSIGGYYLNLKGIVVGALELNLLSQTKYNIVIMCVLDSSGLLSGDGINSNNVNVICRGVRVQLLTDAELDSVDTKRYPYLKLGSVSTDSAGHFDPTTYTPDVSRYSFIDYSTIVTENGQLIHDWVEDRINFYVTHLSELNYFLGDDDQQSEARLRIVPIYNYSRDRIVAYDVKLLCSVDQDYEEEYPSEVSLVDIDKRTHISSSNTYVGVMTTQSAPSNPQLGPTYTGTSDKLSRQDHNHDYRYVNKLSGDTVQNIKTPITFEKSVIFSDVLSSKIQQGKQYPSFSVNQYGTARFIDGKVTIEIEESSGNQLGVIHADKVYNAVWNDYAELYLKDNENLNIEPGTVIAKVKGRNTYGPCNGLNRKLVVGVCSDSYGYLLGGDKDLSTEENLKKYVPVSLSGRVKVKVVQGVKIKEGDLMVPSFGEGLATTYTNDKYDNGCIIGKSLESSDGTKDKVLIQVFLR